MIMRLVLFLFIFFNNYILGNLINFELDGGGIPNDSSLYVVKNNTNIMNLLGKNLKSGDILLIPNKTFYFMGGIQFNNLNSNTFIIDGIIQFSSHISDWPYKNDKPLDCINFQNSRNIIFTSNKK